MTKRLLALAGLAVAAIVGLLVPVGGVSAAANTRTPTPRATPFADVSPDAPKKTLRLLFIHHSVGGRWLADAGLKDRIDEEIWRSHPDGGGLRSALEKQGYQVHEASYGSALGSKTDALDWLPKFRDGMDKTLSCKINDTSLEPGQKNDVVMFKSCFPNNAFTSDAEVDQVKESLIALLPHFQKHPETLFVYVTIPPLAPNAPKEPAWKWLARAVTGKPQPGPRLVKSGPLARKLDDWVMSPDGWLKGYPLKNVVAFDLYDVLTDHGKSDFLAFPTQNTQEGAGFDSHPSREGNERATAEFVPFLNRAVRRAGLSE